MMKVKNTEDRDKDLESWAFRTGRDIAEMKAVQADHTEPSPGFVHSLIGRAAAAVASANARIRNVP